MTTLMALGSYMPKFRLISSDIVRLHLVVAFNALSKLFAGALLSPSLW